MVVVEEELFKIIITEVVLQLVLEELAVVVQVV